MWFAYGVASILRFTGRRVGEQLAAAVDLLARAIPLLLLLFSVVLFVNTEMWQGFSGMYGATVAATGVLLVLVGTVFLAVRLPREVARLERDVAAGPALGAASGSTSASSCSCRRRSRSCSSRWP